MIRLNVKPTIEIVKPYGKIAFGRFVIGNQEMVRRRLLIDSLNLIFRQLGRKLPPAFRVFGLYPIKLLTESGVKRQERGQTVRLEDTIFHTLRPRAFREYLSIVITALNVELAGEKIEGKPFELTLADVPGFPRSVLRLLPRETPVREEMLEMFGTLGLLCLHLKGKELAGRVVPEQELFDFFNQQIPNVTRETIAFEIEDSFQPILRPQRLSAEPRCYVIGRKASGAVRLDGYWGRSQFVLARELPELISEGSVVVVYGKGMKRQYFSRKRLEDWMNSGLILEVEMRRKKRYVLTEAVQDLKIDRNVIVDRLKTSASQVFLKFMRDKHISPEMRRFFPTLAASIELLSSAVREVERYFEAARIAAEYGMEEECLAALLVYGLIPFADLEIKHQTILHHYLHLNSREFNLPGGMSRIITEPMSGAHIAGSGEDRAGSVAFRVQNIRQALALEIGMFRIRSAEDVNNYLRFFERVLGIFGPGKKRREYILFFSAILGLLRHNKPGELKEAEIRDLRIVIAPLAERAGFTEFADRIRDEVFRLANNRSHYRTRKAIEEAYGLTYPELQLHLDNTAGLLKEALLAAGIRPEDFDIRRRVKLPYSAWEKMQSRDIENVGQLYDLLGINIAARDDRLVYYIVNLVKQVLPEISRRNFTDRHGLIGQMRKQRIPVYKDQIIKPKSSGFSAITLRRLTDLGLPIEVQVTSQDRDRVNREEESAHWKYKVCREIRNYYGIEADRFDDIPVDDEINEENYVSLILFGDWKGSYEKTFAGGLPYRLMTGSWREKDLRQKLGYAEDDDLFFADHREFELLKQISSPEQLTPLTPQRYWSSFSVVLRKKK